MPNKVTLVKYASKINFISISNYRIVAFEIGYVWNYKMSSAFYYVVSEIFICLDVAVTI